MTHDLVCRATLPTSLQPNLTSTQPHLIPPAPPPRNAADSRELTETTNRVEVSGTLKHRNPNAPSVARADSKKELVSQKMWDINQTQMERKAKITMKSAPYTLLVFSLFLGFDLGVQGTEVQAPSLPCPPKACAGAQGLGVWFQCRACTLPAPLPPPVDPTKELVSPRDLW